MVSTNVVALDSAVRLTRANTLRSSSYTAKAEQLTEVQRRRLAILEQRLFEEKFCLDDCQSGQLQKPEGHFLCSLGQIWFYYSKPKRKFVLLDFSFDEGGSGGLPVPPADLDFVSCDWSPRTSANRTRRLVALLRFLCLRYREALRLRSRAEALVWRLVRKQSDDRPTCFVKHAVELNMYLPRTPLPGWSILSSFVVTPEQLENRYARSILAGETLCRVATHSEFARFLAPRSKEIAFRPHLARELLEESTSVLNLIFSGTACPRIGLRQFKMTRALKGHPLADDGMLLIVRSELTAQLCFYVTSIASRSLPYHLSDRDTARRAKMRLMKKYSLLADFACLTDQLFDASRPDIDLAILRSHHTSDLKDLIANETAAQEVSKFDQSIHILLTTLGREPCPKLEGSNDLSALHHQLLNLTTELFDPVE
jgi:hypothetical protein